jgi:hypothetical protein
MNNFWITFTDGSRAHCQGDSAYDAKVIAEKVTGKTVADCKNKWDTGSIKTLPYPAEPSVWKFEHPVHGKTPSFCHDPKNCCGKTACPKSYSCVE